jgi:hypothetical protein
MRYNTSVINRRIFGLLRGGYNFLLLFDILAAHVGMANLHNVLVVVGWSHQSILLVVGEEEFVYQFQGT